MANIVNNLRKELEALRTSIAKMQKQAESIECTIAYLQDKDGVSAGPSNGSIPRRTSNSEPSPLVLNMKEILEQHGAPMHRRDIFDALRERGVHVSGNNPLDNIGAHLSLNKNIFRSVGGGYWALIVWDDDTLLLRRDDGDDAVVPIETP